MLMIRFQRTGRENVPTFRVVVAEKSAAAKGAFLEVVGHYLPARTPPVFTINRERVSHWIGKGAAPSATLARLLAREGMKNLDRFIPRYTHRTKKNGGETLAQPAATAAPEALTATVPAGTDDSAGV